MTTIHDFFYTVGVASTSGLAYYIWNNVYPRSLDRLIVDTAWWTLKIQTRVQMAFENYVDPLFSGVVSEKEKHDVRFYYDGVEVASMSYLDALNENNDDFVKQYNKVSYEINDDDSKKKLLMLRDSVDEIMDRGLKKSNVRFINVCVKREEKDDIEIDMLSKGNIYMVGNKLFSKSFLKWILPELDLEQDYTISTIDDNVNVVSFAKNQYIVLNDNGYEVFTLEQEENNDESNDDLNYKKENCYFSWLTGFIKAKDE